MNRKNLWEKVELPPELLGRLNAMIRRVRAIQLLRGVLAVVGMALIATLMIMAVDAAVVIVSDAVRISFSVVGLVLVLLTAWVALVRPLSDRITPVRMARVLETRHPELQERISSALELLGQGAGAASEGSAQLLEILASEAMTDVTAFSAKGEFRGVTLRPVVVVAGASAGLFLLLFAIWPRQTGILFARAVSPTAPIGNLAARELSVEPGDLTIVRGQTVRFRLTVPGESLGRAELWMERLGQEKSVERLSRHPILPGDEETVYDLALPAVKEPFRYRISLGSALTRYYEVTVIDPPAHGDLRVLLSYPDYTGLGSTQFVASAPVPLRLPVGTSASLEADLNRPLFASLLLDRQPRAPGEPPPSASATWDWLVSTNFPARRWGISLHDDRGFTNKIEWAAYEVLPDYPAHILLTYPSGGSFVLPTYGLLKLVYEVKDDYGVDGMRLAILPDNERVPWYADVTPEEIGKNSWRITQEVYLDDFQLGGARNLRIWLEATDNWPVALGGPNLSKSRVVAVKLDNGADKSFADQVRIPEREAISKALSSTVERLEKAAKALETATNKLAKASTPAESDAVAESLAEAEKEAAAAQAAADEALAKARSGLFVGMTDELESLSSESAKPALDAVSEVAMANEEDIPEFAAEAIDSLRSVKDEAEKLAPEVERVDQILKESSDMETIAARQEHQAKLANERQMTNEEMDKWIQQQEELTKSIDELGVAMDLSNDLEPAEKVVLSDQQQFDLDHQRAAEAEKNREKAAANDGQPAGEEVISENRAVARATAADASKAAIEAVKAAREKPADQAALKRARAAEDVARRARDAAAEAEHGARSLAQAQESKAAFESVRKQAEDLKEQADKAGEAALEVKMEALRFEPEPLPADVARAVDLAQRARQLASAAEKAAERATIAHPEEPLDGQVAGAEKGDNQKEAGKTANNEDESKEDESDRLGKDLPPLDPKALAVAAEALASEAEALRASVDPSQDPFLAKSAEIALEAAHRAADVASAVKDSENAGEDEDAARDAAADAMVQAESAKEAAEAAVRSAKRASSASQDQAALAAKDVAKLANAVSNRLTQAADDFELEQHDKKLPDFVKRLEKKAEAEEKAAVEQAQAAEAHDAHQAGKSVAASKRALEAAKKSDENEKAGRLAEALTQDVEARRQANEASRLAAAGAKHSGAEADSRALVAEANRLANRVSNEIARAVSPFAQPASEAEKVARALEQKAADAMKKAEEAGGAEKKEADKAAVGAQEARQVAEKAREALDTAREALAHEARGDHDKAREGMNQAERESVAATRLAAAARALGSEPFATDASKLAHTVSNLVADASAAIDTASETAENEAGRLEAKAAEKRGKAKEGDEKSLAEARRDKEVADAARKAVKAMDEAKEAEEAGRHDAALQKAAEAEKHAIAAAKKAAASDPSVGKSAEASALAASVSNLVAQTGADLERAEDKVSKQLEELTRTARETEDEAKTVLNNEARHMALKTRKSVEASQEAIQSLAKAKEADAAGREEEAGSQLEEARKKADEAMHIASRNLKEYADAVKQGKPPIQEAAARATEAKRLASAVSNLVANAGSNLRGEDGKALGKPEEKPFDSLGEAVRLASELAKEADDTTRQAQRESSPIANNVAFKAREAARAARHAAETARKADELAKAGNDGQALAKKKEAARQATEAARMAAEAMKMSQPISASAPEMAREAADQAVEAARRAQASVQAARDLREEAAKKPGDPAPLKDKIAAARKAADEAEEAAKTAREVAETAKNGAHDRHEEQSAQAAKKAREAADQAMSAAHATRQLANNLSQAQPGAQPTIGESFLKNAERAAEEAERRAADAARLAQRALQSPTIQAADLARQSHHASEALQDVAEKVRRAADEVAAAEEAKRESQKASDPTKAWQEAEKNRDQARKELKEAEEDIRSLEKGLESLSEEAKSVLKNAQLKKDKEATSAVESVKDLLDEDRHAAEQLVQIASQARHDPNRALSRMGDVANIATNTARTAASIGERISPAEDGGKLERSIEKAKAAAGELRERATDQATLPELPEAAAGELSALQDQLRDASSRAAQAADSAVEAGKAMRRMAGEEEQSAADAEEASSPFLPDSADERTATRTPEDVHAAAEEAVTAANEASELAAKVAEQTKGALESWEQSASDHFDRAHKASKAVASGIAKLSPDDKRLEQITDRLSDAAKLTDRAIARARQDGKDEATGEPAGPAESEADSGSAQEMARDAYKAADEAFQSARALQLPGQEQLEAGRQANKSAQNMRRMAAEHARLAGLDPETMRRDPNAPRGDKDKKDAAKSASEDSQDKGGGSEQDDSLEKEESHVDGVAVEMPEFLRKLGFPMSEWIKYRGSLESGQLDEALDKVAPEYRDLVRRYFELLAPDK